MQGASMQKLRVTLAGVGWAGSALARGIVASPDLELVSAVSRNGAGKSLGELLGITSLNCPIFGSTTEALTVPSDVFFEYTKPDVAKSNILSALRANRHVVIGTSGLTNDDYGEIHNVASETQRGVLAVGNFAMTVVLLQKFAEMAARYIDHWEIIDYAHDDKVDAPSGTARELAHRLSHIKSPKMTVPLEKLRGVKESRGATIDNSQIHSIRLPGYVIGAEVIFGMKDQKLIMRHEAGAGAEPYISGALLAIRKVSNIVGLQRGLDTVMEL